MLKDIPAEPQHLQMCFSSIVAYCAVSLALKLLEWFIEKVLLVNGAIAHSDKRPVRPDINSRHNGGRRWECKYILNWLNWNSGLYKSIRKIVSLLFFSDLLSVDSISQ